MRALVLAMAVIAAILGPVSAQQVSDDHADVSVVKPAFTKNSGPVVAIDGGHHNFHTMDGRFAPFAALIRNDGFRVTGPNAAFTPQSLRDVKVLVVSNALNAVNVERWALPTPSAFTPSEIAAVKDWVNSGGALLLIADHLPFAGAAAGLAAAFGFRFLNGFALQASNEPDLFTLRQGTLKSDAVTRGRSPEEAVSSVETFTGSAFQAPAQARPIIVLSKPYQVLMPQVAWEFSNTTPKRPGEGYLQGAVLVAGKGRVAVFGEAAMFSAQVQGPNRVPVGFNDPAAGQNKQFVLNVVRWLAGLLPD